MFMMPNDLSKVVRVDGEKDGAKNRTLRPTLVDRCVCGGGLEPIMVTNCSVGKM